MTSTALTAAALPELRFSSGCTGCGACLLTCPQHAIRPGRGEPPHVIAQLCDGCGECIEICPADAISEPCGADEMVEVVR